MTATWTTPRTWAVGELVTAALMNTHLRDNLDFLKTPIAAYSALGSNFSTTSSSYVDTGLSVTIVTNGGGLDVFLTGYVGVTQIATVTYRLLVDSVTPYAGIVFVPAGSEIMNASLAIHVSGLSAGSHTVKLQLLTNVGTATFYSSSSLYAIERGA